MISEKPDPGPTEALAGFVSRIEYELLPGDVVTQAKRCIMDSIGVSIPGPSVSWGKRFLGLLPDREAEEATLIGVGGKKSVRTAAFFNGCMANILDSVDGSKYGGCHGGCVVVPAVLAFSEAMHASGKAVIAAVVAGYEVMIRAAASVHPSHTKGGHNPDGICGALGTAAAASNLLGLDQEKTMDALSSALYLAPLSLVGDARIGKYLNRPTVKGQAASTGILGAQLAEAGLGGSRTVFEGSQGFCETEADEYTLDRVTEGLGERFEIMGIYFKPYPGERHAHSAVGCALALRKNFRIDPKEIVGIEVRTFEMAKKLMHHYPAVDSSISEHTASLPFLVAAAFQYGQVGPRTLFEETLGEPRVHELSGKVDCVVDPELNAIYPDKTGAIVEVRTTAGEKYAHRIDLPKGDPLDPLTENEAREKFTRYASIALSEEQIEGILELLSRLEGLADIGELTNCLYPKN